MTDKQKFSRTWLAIAIAVSVLVLSVVVSAVWYFFIGRTVWSDVHDAAQTDDRDQLRQVLWTDIETLGEPINSDHQEYEPWVSPDGMELFFVRGRPRDRADAEAGGSNIYISRRGRDGWSEPEPLDDINSAFDELSPRLTADGQFLLFASNRPGGFGRFDIYAARRNEDGTWDPPFNLGEEINTEWDEYSPAPTPDGRRLFFSSNRNVAQREEEPWDATSRRKMTTRDDLFVAEADPDSPSPLSFNLARSLDKLNSRYHDSNCVVSPGGDFLYFASNRPGGMGGLDIYRSRLYADGTIGEPQNLGPGVNTPDNDTDPMLLSGGFELYFSSDRGREPGRYDLYRAESREVFPRRLGADMPTLGWQWWMLLIAIAALVPLLLFLKATDYKHLSLIQKCVLISTLAHVLLCLLLGMWGVSRDIIEHVGEQAGMEVAVNLDVSREVEMREAVRDQSVDLPMEEPALEEVARVEDVHTPQERAQPERIELPEARHDPAMMQINRPQRRPRPTETELAEVSPEIIEQPEVEVQITRRQRLAEQERRISPPEETPIEVDRQEMRPAIERRQAEAPEAASDSQAVATDISPQASRRQAPREVQRQAPETPAPETPLDVQVEVPRTEARQVAAAEASAPEFDEAPPLVEREDPSPSWNRPVRVDVDVPETTLAFASTLDSARTERRRADADAADRPRPTQDPAALEEIDVSPVGRRQAQTEATEPTIEPEAAPPMAAAPRTDVEVSSARASAEVALPDRTIEGVATGDAAPRSPRRADAAPRQRDPEEAFEAEIAQVEVGPLMSREPTDARERAVPASAEPVFEELASATPEVSAERSDAEIARAPMPERTTGGVAEGPAAPDRPRRSAETRRPVEREVAFDSEIDVGPMTQRRRSEPSGTGERAVPDTVEPVFEKVASVTPPVDAPASPVTRGSVHLPALPGPTNAPDQTLSGTPSARPTQRVEQKTRLPDVPVSEILPPGSLASPEALAHRSFQQRQKLIEQMGGSAESEAAVAKALAFMARNQEPDGRWTRFRFGDSSPPGERGSHEHDVGLTGLAALAFLGADHVPGKPGPYRENIADAMDYLVSIQKDDGDLRDGGDLYDQGIATLALAEAAAMTGDPRYRWAALAGAEFIVQAQGGDGGWRYRPGQDGDTSVVGWQAMALYSAERLGFHVPAETVQRAREYFKKVSIGDYGMISGYERGRRHDEVMTAQGAFSRLLLLKEEFSDGQRNEVIDKIMSNLPERRGRQDFYYLYCGALMMIQFQCENWEKWNKTVRELLIDLQHTGGDYDGAWECDTRWGNRGGVIYTTALATSTLEVYYRYLPMLGGETAPDID